MDDRIFFGVLAYIIISALVMGTLPDNFYTGTIQSSPGSSETTNDFLDSTNDLDSTGGRLSFLGKVLSFVFVTWTISGIPVFIGLLINALNLFSVFISGLYIYDKIRGI